MVDRMISPFTLMMGPILFIVALVSSDFQKWSDVITAVCAYILWVLVSRTLRVLPHFYRCPGVLHCTPPGVLY
jgi:hypothetical protein